MLPANAVALSIKFWQNRKTKGSSTQIMREPEVVHILSVRSFVLLTPSELGRSFAQHRNTTALRRMQTLHLNYSSEFWTPPLKLLFINLHPYPLIQGRLCLHLQRILTFVSNFSALLWQRSFQVLWVKPWRRRQRWRLEEGGGALCHFHSTICGCQLKPPLIGWTQSQQGRLPAAGASLPSTRATFLETIEGESRSRLQRRVWWSIVETDGLINFLWW